MPNRYATASLCGHRRHLTEYPPSGGIEWCHVCTAYVGVIVQRIDAELDHRDPGDED